VVLNTIKSSKNVYRRIGEELGESAIRLGTPDEHEIDSSKIILGYLSTSVIPKERKRRVKVLKDLLRNGNNVILVSTQVVEAGVDLDFDMAIRDLGPLDSIVQVAGRCNRNWRNPSGQIFILRLLDDEGREESRKIYGNILPSRTAALLSRRIIQEKDMPELMDEYYKDISYRMNIEKHNKSDKVLEEIKALNYDELAKFSLIEEEPKIPIYVEFDKEAKLLLDEFRSSINAWDELRSLEEIFERRAHIRKIRAKMEDYNVEVYQNEVNIAGLDQIVKELNLNVRYLPNTIVDAYYDKETGFISLRDMKEESFIF
jgi:CRISPR-associated endonuclease/helicase Cas3